MPQKTDATQANTSSRLFRAIYVTVALGALLRPVELDLVDLIEAHIYPCILHPHNHSVQVVLLVNAEFVKVTNLQANHLRAST